MAGQSIWYSTKEEVWKCKLLTDKADVETLASAQGKGLSLDDCLVVLEDLSLWYWDSVAWVKGGA